MDVHPSESAMNRRLSSFWASALGGPHLRRPSGPQVLFVFGLACAFLNGACVSESPAEASEAKKKRPSRAAQVVVAPVKGGSITGEWAFPGDVRAAARASLAVGAAGAVERVAVELGDRFRRGEVLLEVDRALALATRAVARARVKEAQETYRQAQRDAVRLAGLPRGVVPEQQREQADSRRARAAAELSARKAELQEAKAQLDLHRIRAPFDGVVTQRIVDPGDWVRIGDSALEVVSSGPVDVVVDASPSLVGRVQVGDEARLVSWPQVFLRVKGVVPALDPATRTLRIRLEPKSKLPSSVLPGTSVEVAFSVTVDSEGARVVPEDAVLFDGQRSRIVKAEDGKARILEVEVIARSSSEVLLKAPDLRIGDQVIVRGNERVRPGQPLSLEAL